MIASAVALIATAASAQDFDRWTDDAVAGWLAENAEVEINVGVPMRDGVRLSTNIYRPKDAKGEVPVIFWRTPYNYNASKGRDKWIADAVNRGYAVVLQNERGRYHSEGRFQILGYPQTDGVDALDWITEQDWSTDRIGTYGCSSSAEWQLALAAQDHPSHAAMVPAAAGAGIGRVGPFYEQGNWYTGGVQRSLFIPWIYGSLNELRPQFPEDTPEAYRSLAYRYNDLEVDKKRVDWATHIETLPVNEMLSALGEPPGTFEEIVARGPDSEGWYQSGLYHDDMAWGVPALWMNSWYDVSIGPNMALYNHAREAATSEEVADQQYVVVGPNVHCAFASLEGELTVGERSMGNPDLDTHEMVFDFFDWKLKGDRRAWDRRTPRVRFFTMGTNEWSTADTWPPAAAEMTKLYLHSGGDANSHFGDGRLSFDPPADDQPSDSYVYDPMNPVLTIGGGDCCNGGIVQPGARDQRPVSARRDVLVYETEPLDAPVEVSGFVDAVLSVSSDAPDTDFAVKLVDVAPDGTAYIIDDTIFRARYREGYDRQVMMEEGEVYSIDFTPMTTSIVFQEGHRIRVEVTSSNFPKFLRNLNTGADNMATTDHRPARNTIHHRPGALSYIELPIVR